MQLLSVIKARSIWLFDLQDLNPRGKYIESGLIEWLKTNYHFSKYPASISDLDQSGGLAFTNRITSLLRSQGTTVFEPASIGFWPDPSLPIRQSHFQFERKLNTPFLEHCYYSRAPLHTDDHLKLLEEFEDLLIG